MSDIVKPADRNSGLTRRAALSGGSLRMPATVRTGDEEYTRELTKTGWPPRYDKTAEHFIVYRNDHEFAGWPGYCGLWKTADGSIVTGFKRIASNYGRPEDVYHGNLTYNMGEIVVIRSNDNGRTWDQNSIVHIMDMAIKEEKDLPGGKAADWSSLPPLDFTNRDTLIMGGGIPQIFSPNARAWMRASTDGGRTWRPHTLLPNWSFPSISMPGTSMYSVRDDGVMLFGIQTNAPGMESHRPIVYACPDGLQFHYLGEIVAERPKTLFSVGGTPFGSAFHYHPRPIVLKSGRVLSALRYQRDARFVTWTEVFESLDGGRTWHWLSRVNDWGSSGDLVPMADGRIVFTYGYRNPPHPGIRYRVSEDEGKTWGAEMILRDDAGSWDIGYTRVIETEPGTLLTTYYINLKNDPIQMNGGVRHIASTIFKP